MMKRQILPLLLTLLSLFACKQVPDQEEQRAELENTVLGVHDEAMARMNKIYHLRRDLRALRDTLEAGGVDTAILTPLKISIDQLNKADEAMMNWMRQYEVPETLTHEQTMAYLQEELRKIKKVQFLMDSTIQTAKTTYEEYEQSNQQAL